MTLSILIRDQIKQNKYYTPISIFLLPTPFEMNKQITDRIPNSSYRRMILKVHSNFCN